MEGSQRGARQTLRLRCDIIFTPHEHYVHWRLIDFAVNIFVSRYLYDKINELCNISFIVTLQNIA